MSNLDTKHFIYFPRKEPLIIDKYVDSTGNNFAEFTYGGRFDKDTGAILDPMQQIMFQLGGGGSAGVSSLNTLTGDLTIGINDTTKDINLTVDIPASAVTSVNGKTGDVVLYGTDIQNSSSDSVTISGELANHQGLIESNVTAINSLNTEMTGKQDKLTAGDNITIVNNVISATGGTSGITGIVSDLSLQSAPYKATGTEVLITLINDSTDVYLVITGSATQGSDASGEWDVDIYDANGDYVDYMDLPTDQFTVSGGTITFNVNTNLVGSNSGQASWPKGTVLHLYNYDQTGTTFTVSSDFNAKLSDISKEQVPAPITDGIADITTIIPKPYLDGKMNLIDLPKTTNFLMSDSTGQAVEGDISRTNAASELSYTSQYYEIELYQADNDKLGFSLSKFQGDTVGTAGTSNLKFTKGKTYDFDDFETDDKLSSLELELDSSDLTVKASLSDGSTITSNTIELPSGGSSYTAGTDIDITNNVISWVKPDDYLSKYYPGTTQAWTGANANGFFWYAPDGTSLLITDGDNVNYKSDGEIVGTSTMKTYVAGVLPTYDNGTFTINANSQENFGGINVSFLQGSGGIYSLEFTLSGTVTGLLSMITTTGGLDNSTINGQVMTLTFMNPGIFTGTIANGTSYYIVSGNINNSSPWTAQINIQEITK